MDKKGEVTLEELVRLIPKVVLFLVLLSIFIAMWLVVNPLKKGPSEQQAIDIAKEFESLKEEGDQTEFPLLFLDYTKKYNVAYFYLSSNDINKLDASEKNLLKAFSGCKTKPQGCVCLTEQGGSEVKCKNFDVKDDNKNRPEKILTPITLKDLQRNQIMTITWDKTKGLTAEAQKLTDTPATPQNPDDYDSSPRTFFGTIKTTPGINVDMTYFDKVKSKDRKTGSEITKIVLHHTAGSTAKEAVNVWIDNDGLTSAHYIIDRDGEIYYVIDESRRANHIGCYSDKSKCPAIGDCSVCKTNPPLADNQNSIGIEIVNEGDKVMQYTQDQYDALTLLVDDIVKRNPKIQKDNNDLIAHCQITQGKIDPSPLFDWTKIGLTSHLECSWT